MTRNERHRFGRAAVAVAAGSTASVMFSLPKVSGPVGGWLSISAPFDVEVVEHDDVIGTAAERHQPNHDGGRPPRHHHPEPQPWVSGGAESRGRGG